MTDTKHKQIRGDVEKFSTDSKALAMYTPYGWRGKIGLICPSTNTSIEPEFQMMAPDGVSIHVSRAFQDGPQEPALYKQIASNVEDASRNLGSADIDVVAFGCTSCTYFADGEPILKTMSRLTGAPSVLTATAVLDSMKALGVKRIGLATPRTDFVNKREKEWFAEHGIEVVALRSLQMGESAQERANIGRVPPQVAAKLGSLVNSKDADAIFISCTNLPSLSIIQDLENEVGKPVITSNQATFWQCLRLIGIKTTVQGFGKLLNNH
ncbi:MAG: decarboxylase [Rhodospirillaceae bacterium]|nr:decarboxylase [Rhodospirillaceae bacterium]